ncbi:sporulation initiation phosphotransferase F [Clostridium homopropionicum DSM 5847]|uniref:Stage 0 sporulation protein A homolog n=1 Tax=Clostridium homopropionicum DSM 5847 TaxID=1121318 RepID=A0A0L6Z5F1_9CLOT|nr:response regulator [Clostridium homopropionicum]KOA18181.1 sporulation initiation phosphotransferase F [Clostridium homopropionicum DSM 5847]SFF71766.1 Tetratricopeptide repeat-containing protein [Clostridium homopropionicum]
MKKALVVDDTKSIRLLLTTCLETMGYEVSSAVNGEEALNLFQSTDYDIAFIDIKMPEISGTEVLRRIRSLGNQVPVVIMTAFGTVKNAVECTKLNAVAYLQKPFTADKIRAVLSEINTSRNNATEIESCLNKSKEYLELGRINEAYSLLKNVLSINPSCGECYKLIGKVHEIEGNLHEAKRFYDISNLFDK